MPNWLKKILDAPAKTQALLLKPSSSNSQKPQRLPNATIIYGVGAGVLFVSAFSLLVHGRWFASFLVLFIGGCLALMALHFLNHQD